MIHIISSIEQTQFLELAINRLQQNGIEKESIIAVPLEMANSEMKLFDSIHGADGKSLLDLAAVFGTVCSVLGTSFGFKLEWGPIIWGLLGLGMGASFGFVIDYFLTKKQNNQHQKNKSHTEVVLIIKGKEEESRMIMEILKEHKSLGIGILK